MSVSFMEISNFMQNPKHMKFPGNFIWFMQFPVQGHVTFT